MNTYKVREILSHIRRHGKLPTDPYGQRLGVDELMAWFGLTANLTEAEQKHIKRALALMRDAELYLERLEQAERMYDPS